MTTVNRTKRIIGSGGIVSVFIIIACFMVSLIQTQEAYAEKKNVSGTVKDRTELALDYIRSTAYKPPIPVGELNNVFGVYVSDDTEWNNATFFTVWFIENLNFIGHAVITFPAGDQIFRTVKGKIKALNVHDWASEHEGWFLGGTGKYKGIKGRWREKIMHTQTEITTEWEVEYEVK